MVSQLSEITPNYTTASAVAALAYDILLYSVDEIKYIWRSAWSIPKLLYLSSRYYPIIYLSVLLSVKSRANLPQNVCQVFWWYYGFGGLILIVPLVNIILSLRVSALYGNTRKIIAFLSFLFAVEFIGELITTAYLTIPDAAHAISLSGPPYGCDTTVSTNILLVRLDNLAWSVTLFGSFSLFALTVLKLWRYRTKAAPLGPAEIKQQRISEILMESPLLGSLFRDGAFYFFILLASVCLMMIGDFANSPNIWIVSSSFRPWLIAIYSFSGSRLVSNLRRISVEDASHPTDLTAPIQFRTFAARTPTVSDEGVHPEEA